MNELPESKDPLEEWKASYDRDSAASVEVLSRLADMSRFLAGYQQRSADAHLVLFGLTQDPAYLYRAIQVAASGSSARQRPAGAGLNNPVEAATPLFSSALRRADAGSRWQLALLRGQVMMLNTQAATTSRVEDWRKAVRALVKLLAAIQQNDPDRAALTASLAHGRREIAHQTGSEKMLRTALADFENALAAFPLARTGYAELALDTARTAAEVATARDQPDLLARAFTLFEQAAASDAEFRAQAAADVAQLAYHFVERWQEQHQAEDLQLSIDGWRTAAKLSADDQSRFIQNLNNLVAMLEQAREQDDQPGLLDEQVATLERLVRLVPQSDSRRTSYLINLALGYKTRFRSRPGRADVDAAVEGFTQALVSVDSAERRSLTIALGSLLRERYLWSGERPDIDASLAFWRRLLDATPAADPDRAEWLGGVVGTLLARYQLTPSAADLDAAVAAVEEVRHTVAGRQISLAYRHRLRDVEGVAVQERYRELGRAPDLDRLILLSGQDLRDTEPGTANRAARAAEHAFFLLRQFDRDSNQGDLNEAITVLEDSAPAERTTEHVMAETPDNVRARWLTLMGEALLKRYRLWGMAQLDDLARAHDYFDDAVALTPEGSHARVDVLLGLASATEQVFRLGPVPVGDRELPVRLIEEALDQVGTDLDYAPAIWRTLADSLLRRIDSGREQPDDLDRAIELLERAASSGQRGYDAAGGQLELAEAQRERYERSSHSRDRSSAIANYRASIPVRLETNIEEALAGASQWGAWATSRRSWAEAAEAFSLAVTALDEIYLANIGVGATVWLRRAPGLAAEAAYAYAHAGRPADSALVLESAKFRAGSEALALLHTDLRHLARAGHPELADRLRKAATQWRQESGVADTSPPAAHQVGMSIFPTGLWAAAGVDAGPKPEADDLRGQRSGDVDRRAWEATARSTRKARHGFDEAVRAIRAIAGFERFLDEPVLSDITAVSNRHPVMYLASSAHGGLAVAIYPDRPARALFLPALQRSALEAQVARFQEAYQGRGADPANWRTQLVATTSWLWDAVMSRALRLVGRSGPVLLIPTGMLGVLPLHAAWQPDTRRPTGRKYACDRAVISYAPNARSAADAPGGGLPHDTLLAVADPAPLPAPLVPITFADAEVAAAAAWFPDATVLRREEATADRVQRGLRTASVHHLACHGRADLREPTRSALVLADGQPLTVRQLLDLRLDERAGPHLAVLTACESSLAGSEAPDEVISLPGALLQAGFTGAVASQWAVTGLSAAFLTARFYEHWKRDGWDWATALTGAQRWLRDSTDGEKAVFVHPRDGAAWLPVTARRQLWRAVATRDPTGRSFADIADWGAYTYVGGSSPGAARTSPESERHDGK